MSLLWIEAARNVSDPQEHVSHWPEQVHATQAGFSGVVDSPVLHHFTQHHGGDAWSDLHDVDLTGPVHARQKHVFRDQVAKYLDNPSAPTERVKRQGPDGYAGDDHPTFVKWQGRHIVTDGTHRTGAALLRGDKSIKGYVYDADKHGFPDPGALKN